MAIWARTGLKLAVILLTLLTLIYIALYFVVSSQQFRAWAEAEIAARSGLSVSLGNLNLSFPFRVVARTLQISKPREFSLSVDRLTVTIDPFDLPSGTVHRVILERPVFRLNIEQLAQSQRDQRTAVALRYLNVREGTIVLSRGESTIMELPQIDLQAENINLGSEAGIRLRADVPPLKGAAEITIKTQAQELAGEFVLRQKSTVAPFSAKDAQVVKPEMMRLHAKFHAPEKQNAQAAIEGTFTGLRAGESSFTGSLVARAEMDPDFTALSFTGQATLADFPGALAPAARKLPDGAANASFAGTFSVTEKTMSLASVRLDSHLGNVSAAGTIVFDRPAKISNAKLASRGTALNHLKAFFPAPLNQWSYQGEAQLEAELRGAWDALQLSGNLRSENAQVRAENLNTASLSVMAPFEWTPSIARIKQAKFNAAKVDYNGVNRWQLAAEHLQAIASFDLRPGEPVTVDARIEAAGGKFKSPDNSRLGENLRLIGSLQWSSRAAKNSLTVAGKLTADSGELLWGSFFTDLKTPKPALDIDADYFTAEDRLDCRRCNIRVANVGDVETSGSIEHFTETPELRLQARSANFSPGGFFEYFLRENLNRQFPLLDDLDTRGRLAFQTQMRGKLENLAVTGELSLKGGEIYAKSKNWAVGPIMLNLPFQVSWSNDKTMPREQARNGTLAIEKIRFGQQVTGPVGATVSLADNELRFHQPVNVRVFGGEIIARDLIWPNVVSQPKQLSFSLESKRLQLEQLTQAFGWPRFTGTLTGSIPEVQSTGGVLKANGEIQAALFGGRVRMSKLEIENPFSSLAAIKLDATLANIDLEQLSKTFAFGRISGILEGTIADLIITDGQPAQFGADLHTVDRGGEQRISVEALNKITVLSSGQSAGTLYSGLAGFFDSFRYSKLGFKAILRNDRLTLRGVETRGNEEYLVVGTFFPPTVNVVSHTQTIGFSELMRRLERIKADKPEGK
jgi:hypothetical protein